MRTKVVLTGKLRSLLPSRCIFCEVLFVQAEPKEHKPQKQPRQVKVHSEPPNIGFSSSEVKNVNCPLSFEMHTTSEPHGARLARLDFMIWFSRCLRARMPQMVMLQLTCF